MTWTLDHVDDANVYWRREADGYVIGFNKPGLGEPSSGEDSPPSVIDSVAPPVELAPIAPTISRVITKGAFLTRLSDFEKAMMEFIATDKPSDAMNLRLFAAGMRAKQREFDNEPAVDLDDPRLLPGLLSMVAFGVFQDPSRTLQDEARVHEIVDTTPTPDEIYIA